MFFQPLRLQRVFHRTYHHKVWKMSSLQCDCHDTTIPIWTNGFGSLPATLASASICLFSCQKPLLSSGTHFSDSLSRLFGEIFITLHNIYPPVIKHAGKSTIYIVREFSHSTLDLVPMFPCQPRFISTAAVPVQGFVDYQQFSAQLRKLLAEKAHIVHHWFPVHGGATIRWILEKPGSFSASLNFYHIEYLYLDSFFVLTLSLYIKNGFIWYLPTVVLVCSSTGFYKFFHYSRIQIR